MVKQLDDNQFSRLIREAGLTPDLDIDTLVRCARRMGESSYQELFSKLNFVPNREDLVRIMKEIGILCSFFLLTYRVSNQIKCRK